MINCIVTDFESIKVSLPMGVFDSVKEINYDATKEVEVVTNTKGIPMGVARKAYEGSMDFTVLQDDADKIFSAAGGKGLFARSSIPILVAFAPEGSPITKHELMVRITKYEPDIKKDDAVYAKFSGKQTAVMKVNGKPLYSA